MNFFLTLDFKELSSSPLTVADLCTRNQILRLVAASSALITCNGGKTFFEAAVCFNISKLEKASVK